MLEPLQQSIQLTLARGLARLLGLRVKGEQLENVGTTTRPTLSLIQSLGGDTTKTGIRVTPESALKCSAVYMPLFIYRRFPEGNKEPDPAHRLYSLLHDAPNERQTSFEWREMGMGHLCLRGNSYTRIVRDRAAQVEELIPFHPDRLWIYQAPKDGTLFYHVTPQAGEPYTLTAADVLHSRGLSSDGVMGRSPISLAAEPIGLALGAEAYGSLLYRNGARLSGFLKIPEVLGEEEADQYLERWKKAHAGLENTGGIALFDGGMEWVAMGMTAHDAQLLESRQFQNLDIYGLYGVPPHMVGDTSKVTSWGTGIEQQTIGFVTFTLLAWVKRLEQRYNMQLLTLEERQPHFIEFQLAGLIRGDLKSRYQAYAIGRQWGWLSANDIRRLENLNSIGPEGDLYLQPLNMVPAGTQDERQLAEDAEKLHDEIAQAPTQFAAFRPNGKGQP
jgi:HK97 family phage portal protein